MEGAGLDGWGPEAAHEDDYDNDEEYGYDAEDFGDEVDEEGLAEEHYLEQGAEWDQEAEEREDGDDDFDDAYEDDEQEDIFVGQIDPMSLLDDMEQAGGERDGERSIELMQAARQNATVDWEGSSAEPRGIPAKRGRGRPKGSKNKRSRLFGASVDDIYDSQALKRGGPGGRRGKKRKRKGRVIKDPIPKEVADMMSKATADYALGRHKSAAVHLKEVIRRAPNYREAYRVMGLLSEDLGNKQRALAFFMLEAHLSKKDVEPWRRVSRLSMELGFRRQSVYCLGHVIRRAKEDLGARYDKAVLLNELGEPGKAVLELEKLQKVSGGNPDVPRDLARLHHSMNKPRKAMEALERHMGQFPHKSNLTHVNMLCELYMDTNKNAEAKALIENAKAVLCGDSGGQLPIDLQIRLGMCCFRLGHKVEAARHMQPLLEVDDCPDLILLVANMYLEGRDYNSALQFYELLLDGRQNMNPEVLRNVSECYKELGNLEAAVKLYEVAIAAMDKDDKNMLECLLQLCELKIEKGDKAEAHRLVAQAMKDGQDAAGDPQAADGRAAELHLWLSRMYVRLGDRERFLQAMLPTVYATINYLQNTSNKMLDSQQYPEGNGIPRNMRLLLQRRQKLRSKGILGGDGGLFTPAYKVPDRRLTHLKAMEQKYAGVVEELEKMAQEFSKPSEDPAAGQVIPGLLDPKESRNFLLLLQVIAALVENGDQESLEDAQYITRQCLRTLKFETNTFFMRDNLRLMLTDVECRTPSQSNLLFEFRYTMRRWPSSTRVLNLYSQMLNLSNSSLRITRSVTAMRTQYPACVPLMMLAGNMYAMMGAMPEAINEYVQAYHEVPKEPLVSLCLGVAILRDSMAFRASSRHRSVVQAFAFLCEYRRLRKSSPQEAAYNIGRAFQELGLFHLAIPFYEETLLIGQESGGASGELPATLDLTLEAAHNLVLIYQASGAIGLARATMHKYLVI